MSKRKFATYYGSKLHPGQVQLGEPDKYGNKTYVEPDDPRLTAKCDLWKSLKDAWRNMRRWWA